MIELPVFEFRLATPEGLPQGVGGDIDHRRLKAGLSAGAITAASQSPVAACVDHPIAGGVSI
jgi:hypothetical protein